MPKPPGFNPPAGKGQNTVVGKRVLPASGRLGPPPPWPVGFPAPSDVEAEVWAELWKLPQAVAWSDMSVERTVARYTRMLVEASQPGAAATLHAQVTVLDLALGLSPKALRLLLWVIEDVPTAGDRPVATGTEGPRRLRAVD